MAQTPHNRDEEFVRNVSSHQRRIYAFILRLVPKTADALDLVQETNLVLWQKRDDFQPGTDFGAWACRVAQYTVMTYRKKASRERMLFSDDLVGVLADEAGQEVGPFDEQLIALSDCLERLPMKDRELLQRRYADGQAPRQIASCVNRSAHAVAQALYRIRSVLLECMDGALAEGTET